MPNWCNNTLSVRGRRADVSEFAKFLDGLDGGLLNAVIPMPAELRGTRAPAMLVTEDERDEYLSGKKVSFGGLPITHAMQVDYLSRFGADNWYDWAVDNWDTKWDVPKGDLCISKWKQGTGITVGFDTAWAPPIKVIRKLSEKFPKLKMSLSWNEPGMCAKGREVYEQND